MKNLMSPLITAALLSGLTSGLNARAADDQPSATQVGGASATDSGSPITGAPKPAKKKGKAMEANAKGKHSEKSGCGGKNGCDGKSGCNGKNGCSAEGDAPATK